MSVRLIILKMLWKQKIVHFLEEAGEDLRLAGPPVWHAVQLLNILENFGFREINRLTCRSWPEAQCLALSLLDLTSKLEGGTHLPLVEYARTIQSHCSDAQFEQLMHKHELIILTTLKWRLASPLLVEEVSAIVSAWQQYSSSSRGSPIILEERNCSFASNSQLSRNTRICLYNLSHLIKGSQLDSISQKIRWLSLAIVFVTIKNTLGSKVSSTHLLNDFLKRRYGIVMEDLNQENAEVSQVLGNYELYRERSRGRKESKKAKLTHKSNKQSEDKENIKYYVNRQKRSTGKPNLEGAQQGEPIKSRSRSRKDPSKELRGLPMKDSLLAKAKKKSNSAKSLFHKQSILLGRQEQCLQKKRCVKYSKNKGSKVSEKSQASKLISNLNIQLVSKSTHSLKTNAKKSNHSSIRMKLR